MLAIKKLLKHVLLRYLRSKGFDLVRIQKSDVVSEAFLVQSELIMKDDPLVLDIGAHEGSTSKSYRMVFPNAHIHCFEPCRESFEILKALNSNDSRAYCHPFALSACDGKAMMNVNKCLATNSLLETDSVGSDSWGDGLLETTSRAEVRTVTVDTFCREQNIPHVDILKMDVQGAEYSVLLGAQEMLRGQRVSVVYTELILCPTYQGQRMFHEYLALLKSLGYDLLDTYNPVRKERRLLQVDAVFYCSSIYAGVL